jgi:hypothetical protein
MVLDFILSQQRRGLPPLRLICRSRKLLPQVDQIFIVDEALHGTSRRAHSPRVESLRLLYGAVQLKCDDLVWTACKIRSPGLLADRGFHHALASLGHCQVTRLPGVVRVI